MNNNFDAWPLSRTSLAGSQTTRTSSTSSQGQNGVRANNPNHRSMPSSSNSPPNIFFDAWVLSRTSQHSTSSTLAPLYIPGIDLSANDQKSYNGTAAASPGSSLGPKQGFMPPGVGRSNDH